MVLQGCETWSLILQEEDRLRAFDNTVLRRIFGPKRNEIISGSRKFPNEELPNFYSSPDIIRMIQSRRITWPGYVARMQDAYRILLGTPE
jgi:hypothetical protein